jgi:hypothetical protein
MDWDLEGKSSEALEALEQGEPVEVILSRYPEDADSLRPILEMARELQSLPLAYAVSAQQSSRDAMLAEARRLRGRPAPIATRFAVFRRLSFAFAALLFLFIAGGALLARPVSAALPGQPLYPLKRAAETVQMRLTGNPSLLETRFREERREELFALLALGAEAEVDCFGTIRSFTAERWQLDDFVLFIPDETTVEGQPAIGAPVEGKCLVSDGQVFAQDVRITGPGKLPPEPPDPALTPQPTPGPSPTPSVTPTPTATGTVTPESLSPGGPVGPAATPDDDHDDDDDSSDSGGDDNGDDSGSEDSGGDDNVGDDSGSDDDGDDNVRDDSGSDDDGDDSGGDD